MKRNSGGGFTLVELLTVIAMIGILMGAVSTSVAKARERAKISRAAVECREITNAILAYENYDKKHSLSSCLREDQDADRSSLKFILGEGVAGADGDDVPVLYNGALVDNKIVDPWGRPYKITIREASDADNPNTVDATAKDMKITVFVPNNARLSPGERGE